MVSSTTVCTCQKLALPVLGSRSARMTWPRFPYSFLYAEAKDCSTISKTTSFPSPFSEEMWSTSKLKFLRSIIEFKIRLPADISIVSVVNNSLYHARKGKSRKVKGPGRNRGPGWGILPYDSITLPVYV